MEKKTNSFKDLVLQRKAGHLDQIIAIGVHPEDDNLAATCSEDNTVRMWDFRKPSSGKFFRNSELKGAQLSNVAYHSSQQVFVAAGPTIYSFDSRKQGIILNEVSHRAQRHTDDVNHLAFNRNMNLLAACDDEGDCFVYNPSLQRLHALDQEHTNVLFCTEFIYPEQYKQPVCVTAGFDMKLIFWDLAKNEPIKQINFQQILAKYAESHCPPHIYSICPMKSSVILSTESGHVVHIPFAEPKKPKFAMTASLAKVIRCCMSRFHSNILLTLAADSTFSMFDFVKRDVYSCPQLIQRYKTCEEPNWIESTGRHVLIADKSTSLSVFSFKG